MNIVHLGDCMEGMKDKPDKYYDLAIVDPPYGIGRSGRPKSTSSHGGHKGFEDKGWDKSIPNIHYFYQLYRVSKNQIIWGANYMPEYLRRSSCWIVWDKGQRIDQADAELAYTSFESATRVVTINRVHLLMDGTIHPTQKPIKLYKWLLKNYAKEGDKILSTHVGSGSDRIAAFDMGFWFEGWEIDPDYHAGQEKRFNQHKAQLKIFS
jgi:site-specific DNA-methyltransferase (adenine-specific)